MEYAIEMRNIIQRFSSKEVLKGIDLKIHSGEIFGLLGPSGAGKTTLIKILTGQLSPSAGSAVILGKSEPANGLDPATATQIHELIQDERKRGATVFLTTHNMEEADKLCDHIALLDEGRIVEYGEPEEIRRKHNHQNKLQIRLRNGRYIELPSNRTAAEAVKEYLEAEMVETIHSTEPSLETVFLELTGRGFE